MKDEITENQLNPSILEGIKADLYMEIDGESNYHSSWVDFTNKKSSKSLSNFSPTSYNLLTQEQIENTNRVTW